MRLGVVSDIHGNLPALQAVVAAAGAVDGWLNLGDIVSGPLWPEETAAWLMQQGWPTIAGNHERQVLAGMHGATAAQADVAASDRFAAAHLRPEQRAWIAALPPSMQPAPGLMCVHGTPQSDLIYLLETVTPAGRSAASVAEVQGRLGSLPAGTALLLCGHSHVPRSVSVGPLHVANPGSVGLQAYAHDWPYPHTVHNGSPQARYAIVEQSPSGWQLQLCTADYDHAAAARKAQAEGFDDWAHALATGQTLGNRGLMPS